MPLYTYIATDGQGAEQSGVLQASNEQGLRDELQKRGLSLVSLTDLPEINEPEKPDQTRYQFNDKVIFIVGYDSIGGPFSYANRVVSKAYTTVPPPVVSTAGVSLAVP